MTMATDRKKPGEFITPEDIADWARQEEVVYGTPRDPRIFLKFSGRRQCEECLMPVLECVCD